MATIYFTSNADNGDGTLRAAMESAASGDTVMPDPETFTDSGDITITLSSELPLVSVNVEGYANKRIIFDRQNSGAFLRMVSSGYTVSFKYCDFTHGYRTSGNESPFYLSSASTVLTFDSCKFYGNTGAYAGFLRGISGASGAIINFYNCVAYNNAFTNSNYTASVFTVLSSAGATITLSGCTFDGGDNPAFTNEAAHIITDSLYTGNTDTCVDFDEVGIVSRSDYDYRLAPGSDYLTGGTLTGTDILGHTRTGSKGAYDGSWLVSPFSLTEDTEADYADIQSAGTLADGILVSVDYLYASGGSLSSSGRAYFCAGSISGITYTNVVAAVASGVTAISASITENVATIEVTATGTGYVVECSDDLQSWETLTLTDGKATLSNSNALYFRVFDGDFLRSEIIPRYYYYQGASSGGSFAEASDWSLDKAGTIALSEKPTIEGCYFDLR